MEDEDYSAPVLTWESESEAEDESEDTSDDVWEGTSSGIPKKKKCPAKPKLDVRDVEFSRFLEDIDVKICKIQQLNPEEYACTVCNDAKATLFCEHCINYFCADCHANCSSIRSHNHSISFFSAKIDYDPAHKRQIHFANTFERRKQSVKFSTAHALCRCGNKEHHKSFQFARKDQSTVFLHANHRLTTGDFNWCDKCQGTFAALWAYGYLFVNSRIVISRQVCEMMQHMEGSSFKSLHDHILAQNALCGISFALKDLTLAKYCYLQVRKRLRHHPPCFCCIDPITGENKPDLAIVDYTTWVRDSTSSSFRSQNCQCVLLADETEFSHEMDILKEACEKAGSASTPQMDPPKSGRDKCKDGL